MPINARYEIGELDQRIELQTAERVSDGQGGFDESWTTQATVWAHVRPMRGSEREQADRQSAEGGYMVVIRHREDINETWRLRWVNVDRLLNIRFVPQRGGRELYTAMECEIGVGT